MPREAAELEDSSLLIQLVYPAMLSMGINTERVFERCNIDNDLLEDRSARTPHSAQRLFWQTLEEETGDPLIGWHIARHIPIFQGQVLSYLFLSSATFGDGLKRVKQYQRLITDAMDFEMQFGEQYSCINLGFSTGDHDPLRHRDECFTRYMIRYFRALTGDAFIASSIDFEHEAAGPIEEYTRDYSCPIHFGQSGHRIHFKTSILDTPSEHAEPELHALHEQLADAHLARLEKQDVIASVRRIVGEILEEGQPELSTVAERLGVSARSLRSQLAEADTNFNQVLTDYRCGLAKKLLSKTDESIADVVYLTGFSEPSTFYRAFKRWTGVTPVEYRQQFDGGEGA